MRHAREAAREFKEGDLLRPKTRHCASASATLAFMLLAGCAIPDVSPKVHVLESTAIGLKGIDVAPVADWWLGLNDRQLNRIMGDALAGNPTLDDVLSRLRLASAGVEAQKAGLLPHVAIDGEEQPTRISGDFTIPPPYAGSDRRLGTIQTSLSWTLDFAGKQHALISQATQSADAAALDLAAARAALTGAVGQTYVALTLAEHQMQIAEAFVNSREESLALARTRSRNDLASDFEIRAAETLLAEAQQSLDKAKGDQALMTHALAALAGRGADAYSDITSPTLSFDAALPLPASLPANLLERRPDVLAARARIGAASAGREAAKADFYPSVDLRAFLGVSSVALSSLLTSNALTYGAGPAIHVPVFEGGELQAQYKAATADIDAATASYNSLALRAVQESADALSGIDSNAAEAADQRKILNGLAETMHLDEVRAHTGLGTQLDVLASGDRLLQARLTLEDLAAEGLTRRIQLLVAVGGDFNPDTATKFAAADGANPKARP
jgi:NodT family efflux transporter outer membrane factor (OMF) lipoprotein